MIDCPNGEVRDVLPEYLHERLEPRARAAVAAHLESCELCSGELALLGATRDALSATPPMRVDRIVAALPVPSTRPVAIRTLPARRHRFGRRPVVAAAAIAAAALIVAGVFDRGEWQRGAEPLGASAESPPAAAAADPPPNAAQASALAATERAALPELTFAGGVADLTAGDLEELIAELDAIEALPATEPQPVLLSLPATVSGDD